MTAQPQPWERRPDESAQACAAFAAYRNLPPGRRSLSEACAQVYGGSTANLRQLEAWSRRRDWVARARTWDDQRDRASRASELEAIREMRDRHIRTAMSLQGKGLAALRDARYISARTALDMVTRGMELERQARGEPEDPADQVPDEDPLVAALASDPQLPPSWCTSRAWGST